LIFSRTPSGSESDRQPSRLAVDPLRLEEARLAGQAQVRGPAGQRLSVMNTKMHGRREEIRYSEAASILSTLYKDSLIEVTDQEIVFPHYYFPFGGSKHVPLSRIQSIQVRPPSLSNGSWRLWGSGDFRTWFPQDFARPGRDRISIASLRDGFWRIGFTVEDSQKVTSVLNERGLLHETPSA
jgi:hypothetical protein